MSNSTVVDYAETYLNLGFQVIPIHSPIKVRNGFVCSCGRPDCQSPAKHPVGALVRNGAKSATSDLSLAKQWFDNGAFNIGIVTGSSSRLVVLDVDPRHDGDETIAALEEKHGAMPQTLRFLTGGGGHHIMFRHPGGNIPNSAGKIGKGIDVRGENGFVVAPPSMHISGRPYAMSVDHRPDDIVLADPPSWLCDKMRANKGVAVSVQERRNSIGSIIPEGSRNDSLARICGYLLAHKIDPHLCLDLMIALNGTQCKPPLPESEVIDIVASITNCEIAKRSKRRFGGINCG